MTQDPNLSKIELIAAALGPLCRQLGRRVRRRSADYRLCSRPRARYVRRRSGDSRLGSRRISWD